MRSLQRGALIMEDIKNRKDKDGINYPITIEFQFNPESLKRTLKIVTPNDTLGGNSKGENRHADPRDLKSDSYIGQTITVAARFDGKVGDGDSVSVNHVYSNFNGNLLPVIAILEKMMDPVETQKIKTSKKNVNPPKILPLIFFWWGENRILPVKITQMTVNETEFGPELFPIRVEMDFEMEVLVKGSNSDISIVNAYNYMTKKKDALVKTYVDKFAGVAKTSYSEAVNPQKPL